jgi:phosphoglycolate phosphatase-like HAD superfamily hydrolase
VRALGLLRERHEAQDRDAKVPSYPALDEWIARETKLGNATLATEVERGNNGLTQVKVWSDAVNEQIADIVHGVPPFPLVRDCLGQALGRADMMVISQTPCDALEREWAEHDLARFVQAIAGQEMGTKTEHLQFATTGKYPADKVLMIGDAPGDHKAAKANSVLFYPILPGREEASWERLHSEALGRFFDGTYAGDYEASLFAEFDASLPEHPSW